MRFVVDGHLGGLVKWLRFCGFDARSQSLSLPRRGLPPPEAGTYLLTSQRALAGLRRPDLLFITGATPSAQLKEVFQRLKISRRQLNPLSRCVRCNELLVAVPREQVQGLVPEHIFLNQRDFYQCPGCRRLFWPGSHLAAIAAQLDQALGRGKGGRKVGEGSGT